MELLSIGTASLERGNLRNRLLAEFRSVPSDILASREEMQSGLHFFHLSSPEDVHERTLAYRYRVAEVLADHIVDDWEINLIDRIISTHYDYFTDEERQSIQAYTQRNLNMGSDSSFRLHRKSRVMERLLEYLEGADQILIEGFVTFRLREYLENLEEAVDRAVDDLLLEREYKEFVRLLQYFVQVQEVRIAEVHVYLKGDGTFGLQDKDGNNMNHTAVEELVMEMVDADFSYEDLLISNLISAAPQHVVIHYPLGVGADESVEMIKNVFVDRCTLCAGCKRCTKTKH